MTLKTLGPVTWSLFTHTAPHGAPSQVGLFCPLCYHGDLAALKVLMDSIRGCSCSISLLLSLNASLRCSIMLSK